MIIFLHPDLLLASLLRTLSPSSHPFSSTLSPVQTSAPYCYALLSIFTSLSLIPKNQNFPRRKEKNKSIISLKSVRNTLQVFKITLFISGSLLFPYGSYPRRLNQSKLRLQLRLTFYNLLLPSAIPAEDLHLLVRPPFSHPAPGGGRLPVKRVALLIGINACLLMIYFYARYKIN